jgi:hypothetical protein
LNLERSWVALARIRTTPVILPVAGAYEMSSA